MPMDWGLSRDYAASDGYPEEMRVTEAEWLAGGRQAALRFSGSKTRTAMS
jgi:hypothetical protein